MTSSSWLPRLTFPTASDVLLSCLFLSKSNALDYLAMPCLLFCDHSGSFCNALGCHISQSNSNTVPSLSCEASSGSGKASTYKRNMLRSEEKKKTKEFRIETSEGTNSAIEVDPRSSSMFCPDSVVRMSLRYHRFFTDHDATKPRNVKIFSLVRKNLSLS